MMAWRSRCIGLGMAAVAAFGGCQLVSGVDDVQYEEDGSGAGTTAAESTATAASTTAAAGMGGAGGSMSSSQPTTTTAAMMTTTTTMSTGTTMSPCNGNGRCDENENVCICPDDCADGRVGAACDDGCCDPRVDMSSCGGFDPDCEMVPECNLNSGEQACMTSEMNCSNCTMCNCQQAGQTCLPGTDAGWYCG